MSDDKPIEPTRLQELQAALDLILNASIEERAEIFKFAIEPLETRKAVFEEPENRFDTYSNNAIAALDEVARHFRYITGFNAGWAIFNYEQHVNSKAGRPTKYNQDTRRVNCYFITKLVERGASETQAMKLIARLRGDRVESSGSLAELRQSFRDYKAIGLHEWHKKDDPFNAETSFMHLLDFDITHLEGKEKASIKAVAAFRAYCQELIDLMKETHDLIARHDRSYPDLFGCAIDWVKADYDDPLDYFYIHPSHQEFDVWHRKHCLREYVNAAYFFKDEFA